MELIKNISLRQFNQNKKIDFKKELLELEPLIANFLSIMPC